MKNLKSIYALAVLVLFVETTLIAQEPKILREIKNDFIERKEDWKKYEKLDFLQMASSKLKGSLSGGKLTVKNKETNLRGIEIASENRERFWMDYRNAKLSVSVSSDDKEKFAGLTVDRLADQKKDSKIDVDKEQRNFVLLINGKGAVKITRSRKSEPEILYSSTPPPLSFKSGSPSRLTIERIGLTWKFFVNDLLVHSYLDNSNGVFSSIRFTCDADSKATFETPAFIFYDVTADEPYYRSTINGKYTYTDNVAGFRVIEDILKACPTMKNASDAIRYQTKPCPEMVNDNPIDYGDMTIGLFKLKQGEISEERWIELRKESYIKNNSISNYIAGKPMKVQLTGFKDVVEAKYIDETFETDGKPYTARYFYFYNQAGMVGVMIKINGHKPIEGNKFYQASMQSLVFGFQ